MTDYRPDASCPLDGVRVLDLTRLVAGNMLTLQLADFGADVVKVEPPGKGDPLRDWLEGGLPAYWKVYGRNKKSVTLDLKRPAGRDLLLRLSTGAHVLVESFRPGVLEALGLGPETLHARNPRLVVVRLTGWGQTGAYRDRPGFGSLVEGMSGFAAKTGFADKPPVLPNMALADMVAGIQGAMATLVALREVELKGGSGQVIDLSLLEPLVSILGPDAAAFRITGVVPPRSGNRASITAPRNIYRTSDSAHVALSASTQAMTERLFRAIGRPELIDDPRFRTNADRLGHVEEIDAIVGGFIGRRTLAENVEFFERAEVTIGPVYDVSQFAMDRHVREREVIVELPDEDIGRLPMHNIVPRLSRTPGAIRRRAPRLGEHNAEVFGAVGLTAGEIRRLEEEHVL
jgi:crotonobetainyl-CoA:carnitine CoA-transferase CaiB-like acyl-CoA transferase